MNMKEFYSCPGCGRAISGEKTNFFVCPNCGKALCQESKLKQFDDRYCGNCGTEIVSAKQEALTLIEEGN